MARVLGAALTIAVMSIGSAAAASVTLNGEVSAQSRPGGGISSIGDSICPPGTARAGRRVRNLAACNRPLGAAQQPPGKPTRGKK